MFNQMSRLFVETVYSTIGHRKSRLE